MMTSYICLCVCVYTLWVELMLCFQFLEPKLSEELLQSLPLAQQMLLANSGKCVCVCVCVHAYVRAVA